MDCVEWFVDGRCAQSSLVKMLRGLQARQSNHLCLMHTNTLTHRLYLHFEAHGKWLYNAVDSMQCMLCSTYVCGVGAKIKNHADVWLFFH